MLDFAAATKTQRAWFRELIERTHVEHELHFVDAPDVVCKTQLRDRSRGLPVGTRCTTEENFEAIMRISSLRQRMRISMSSAMSVFSTLVLIFTVEDVAIFPKLEIVVIHTR